MGREQTNFDAPIQRDVSNEQIWHAYDVSDTKAKDLLQKLEKDLSDLYEEEPLKEALQFRTVVLLDDFTASGKSYSN